MAHAFETSGPLGTHIVVRVGVENGLLAERMNATVLATIEHYESILSRFRSDSAFCRWRRGELNPAPIEVVAILRIMERWRVASNGALDPQGASAPGAPTRRVYELDEEGVNRVGDCSTLDLNATAKGWIVDRALDAARLADDSASVLISAGGDIAWRGEGTEEVGIENPLRPFDNEPALATIKLRSGALATSGATRRQVGPDAAVHILDPESGAPADSIASVSVVAGDAATADSVATAAIAMGSAHAPSWLETIDEIDAALTVEATGRIQPTTGWLDHFGPTASNRARS